MKVSVRTFHMTPQRFSHLLGLVGPAITCLDITLRQAIPPDERLAITLRYLNLTTATYVPGLPRSVRVLIMRMRKRQTFEERGRPGQKHHVRGRRGVDAWWAWQVIF